MISSKKEICLPKPSLDVFMVGLPWSEDGVACLVVVWVVCPCVGSIKEDTTRSGITIRKLVSAVSKVCLIVVLVRLVSLLVSFSHSFISLPKKGHH